MSMAYEQAITFPCAGETLLGILHRPPHVGGSASAPATAVGIVVIVGGPQYRAGSHRQFVQLARALAQAGHPVLRFDVRGMGDSTGTQRSFEQISPDVGAAINALQRALPEVRKIALWGLCDGASAALLYIREQADPRVAGLCLLNPWVRSEASLARTHVKHYYLQRLGERAFWLKLLSGKIAGDALRGLLGDLRAARQAPAPDAAAPFQSRMNLALNGFRGRVLLALSGNDYTAKEFIEFAQASPSWQRALARPGVQRRELPTADHTLSAAADRDAMNSITVAWLAALC